MKSNLSEELNKAFLEATIYGTGLIRITSTINGIEVKNVPIKDIKELLGELDETL